MLGVATVETNSYRKNAAFDGMLDYGQESSSVIKRNLLNPDEIIRMKNDEQIIILRGHNPFKCKKLKYWDYRLGKDLEKVSIKEYNPKNELKEISIEENKIEEKLPTFEEFLRGRRDNNL